MQVTRGFESHPLRFFFRNRIAAAGRLLFKPGMSAHSHECIGIPNTKDWQLRTTAGPKKSIPLLAVLLAVSPRCLACARLVLLLRSQ